MPVRMTPTVGYAMMAVTCSAVIAAPECSMCSVQVTVCGWVSEWEVSGGGGWVSGR